MPLINENASKDIQNSERPSSKHHQMIIKEERESIRSSQNRMKLNLDLEKKESSAINDTSNLNIPLPSTEEESPTIEPSINRNAFIYESGGLTPPPDVLARKASASISSNLRPADRKGSGRDASAIGSSTDLETTQGSNPGSLQEDKIPNKQDNKPLHTEPAKKTEEDVVLSKNQAPVRILWIPERDRSATVAGSTNYVAGSITKRRDVKYTKKSEKPFSNTGRDACSIDMGQRDKTVDRIRHLDHYGSLQTLENDVLFERDASTVPSRNIIGPTINVLTPSTAENMKNGEPTRKDSLRRKARKGALEAESLPKVEKLKQRQNSWSVKKKGGLTTMTPNIPISKEKTLLKKTQEISRALNLTGGAMTSMMSEERTPSSMKKNLENRPTSPTKVAKVKVAQDLTRRQNSLLATYKTPTKDMNELASVLPSIRQEIRKTKTTFVSQAEKLLQVRNDAAFTTTTSGNMMPHPPPSRFTKAVTPFVFKY